NQINTMAAGFGFARVLVDQLFVDCRPDPVIAIALDFDRQHELISIIESDIRTLVAGVISFGIGCDAKWVRLGTKSSQYLLATDIFIPLGLWFVVNRVPEGVIAIVVGVANFCGNVIQQIKRQ